MAVDDLKTLPLATGTAAQPLVNLSPRTGGVTCLVVAGDPRRRNMLADAALEAGWNVARHAEPEATVAYVRRAFVQLALVDMTGLSPSAAPSWRQLVEQLAVDRELMLAICGESTDESAELWARQLGVWMYLPDVTAANDLGPICADALAIAERLSGVIHRSVGVPAPYRRHRGG